MSGLDELFLDAEKAGKPVYIMRLTQNLFDHADLKEVADCLKAYGMKLVTLNCNGNMDACLKLAGRLAEEGGLMVILESDFHKIYRYGLGNWAKASKEAGIVGIHCPNLPLEEQNQLRIYMMEVEGACLLSDIDPSSGDRIVDTMETAKGFLWTTKEGSMDFLSHLPGDPYTYFLFAAEAAAKLPIVLDFNINNPAELEEYEMNMAGAVIGDALMRCFAAEGYHKEMLDAYCRRFVS